MKANNKKLLIFTPFLLLLWLPMLQDNLHVFKGGALHGSYEMPPDIQFDFKYWFDGSYAEKKTDFLKHTFGFRADFVRLHNQLEYWFFKNSVNGKVIIGKNNYLYEEQYINELNGSNYIGEEAILKNLQGLKEIQDSFARRGIFVFTVFAPGKGSFYPEFIPDEMKKTKNVNTNYDSYIYGASKMGINFIDMRAWFLAMKDTSTHLLFSRYGVHWSEYGDFIAFDSIVKYVEKNTGRKLPSVKLDSVQYDTKPRGRDYDAGDGLNLIFNLNSDTLTYPFYSTGTIDKQDFPLLTIADSYFWEMFNYMAQPVFGQVDFWYYFMDFHSYSGRTATKENALEECYKQKVICLMYTDGGLNRFGSGFIQYIQRELHKNKNRLNQ